jgi:hypothetical protein
VAQCSAVRSAETFTFSVQAGDPEVARFEVTIGAGGSGGGDTFRMCVPSRQRLPYNVARWRRLTLLRQQR